MGNKKGKTDAQDMNPKSSKYGRIIAYFIYQNDSELREKQKLAGFSEFIDLNVKKAAAALLNKFCFLIFLHSQLTNYLVLIIVRGHPIVEETNWFGEEVVCRTSLVSLRF